MIRSIVIASACLLMTFHPVQAQVSPDSLAQSAADSVSSPSGIDSVVTYSASDSVVYSLQSKTMYMHGGSTIKYKELGLDAEKIDINWNNSMLHARGVPDSADTSGTGFRGRPEMIDGAETYDGTDITYNFKTKKGKINLGETEIDKGYYHGERIKKVEDDVLYVADGKYTTCELDHPHYFFGSPEMKIQVKDKIVARPLYLYVSDVPVFALPFGVFPDQKGRRSGIIMPAYGESNRGRYLLHLGYYWAMSDYTDWSLKGDGYSKGSWVLYSDFRYSSRYNFTGALSGSYAYSVEGEPGDPDYSAENLFNLRFNHSQEFNPTTRLIVDLTFSSGSYYQKTSNILSDLLRQNIVSNATLTKSWEGTPNSMTLNVRRDQNLQSGEIRELLPSFGFNRAQSFPFRFGKSSGTTWYELIGFTYSGAFLNQRNKLLQPDSSLNTDERLGTNQIVAVNASPKLGHVVVTPFFNYTEKWYNKSIEKTFNPADSTVTTSDVSGFRAVRYYDLGISTSTKFYGIFQPGIFGLSGLRHQVTPSIAFTYQPDFSSPNYEYFDSYVDEFGRTIEYSRFEREVFGGAPGEKREALSFRIGNVFEAKTESQDTSGQPHKFQLLNFDIGSGYNFARDSLNWDEIGMVFRTSVGKLLDIGGSARYNLYKFEPDPFRPSTGRRVNKFLLSEEGRLAELTNFSFSISTSISGEKQHTTSGPIHSPQDSIDQIGKGGYTGLIAEEPVDFSIPWNLQLSWNFSQNQPDPRVKTRSSSIAAALGFNLTDNWKFTASTSYDVLNRQITAPQISVYRDLHCWEMNFNWVPTGQYRNFRIEIRLKSPILQDVKVTKQGSASGIY